MKYITKYKSPNYNSRNNSKIQLIIIHYTALKNTLDAISYLCNKEKKVSSHYLISQNGTVYNLVEDKFRAWHAGQSFWQEIIDINKKLGCSIPEGADYLTLAGFLLEKFQMVPKIGDVLEFNDMKFEVISMSGPKIDRVKIILPKS